MPLVCVSGLVSNAASAEIAVRNTSIGWADFSIVMRLMISVGNVLAAINADVKFASWGRVGNSPKSKR